MPLTDLKEHKSGCSFTTENGRKRVCFGFPFVVMMRWVATECTGKSDGLPRGKVAPQILHQQKQ